MERGVTALSFGIEDLLGVEQFHIDSDDDDQTLAAEHNTDTESTVSFSSEREGPRYSPRVRVRTLILMHFKFRKAADPAQRASESKSPSTVPASAKKEKMAREEREVEEDGALYEYMPSGSEKPRIWLPQTHRMWSNVPR